MTPKPPNPGNRRHARTVEALVKFNRMLDLLWMVDCGSTIEEAAKKLRINRSRASVLLKQARKNIQVQEAFMQRWRSKHVWEEGR